MENGKFAALFVIALVAVGGVGLYSYSAIDDLRQDMAQIQTKNLAAANEAKTMASQSIKGLDTQGAEMKRLGQQVNDLSKKVQDSTVALTDTQTQVNDIVAKLNKPKPMPAKTAAAKHPLNGTSGSSTPKSK